MAVASFEPLLRHLRKLVGAENDGPRRDRELMRRFAVERDETAFTELVERHATLVQGVCQRVLGQVQDAEDAFQATFLVLARRSAAIRNWESLSSWLHGVAYRISQKARVAAAVRHEHERRAVPPQSTEGSDEISWREVRQVLDDELQRLPPKYREPLLRCYLEGKSQEEAAQELGWTPGTLRGRLDRGREQLRQRLVRRGITLSSAIGAMLVAQSVGRAAAPAALRLATVQAALGANTTVAPQVMVMTEAMLKSMWWAKCKVVALLSVVLLLAAGAGGLAFHQAQQNQEPQAEKPAPRLDLYGDPLPDGVLARLGTLRYRSDSGGSVYFLPGAKSVAMGSFDYLSVMDRETGKQRKMKLGNEPVRALTVSPDGKLVAGSLMDKSGPRRDVSSIGLWEVETGQPVRTLQYPDPKNYLYYLTFSPDSQTLAVGGNNPVIRVLDVKTGEVRWQVDTTGYQRNYHCVAFSPDGKMLAGPGEKEGTLSLFDATNGTKLRDICQCSHASSVSFSPDSKLVAATVRLKQNEQIAARIWNVATGQQLPMPEGQEGMAVKAVFSPDGKTLAANHGLKSRNVMWGPLDIGLWDVASGKKLRQFQGGWDIVFSPDGKDIASSYGSLWFHDVATGKELYREYIGHQSMLWSVAFSADGKSVVTEDRHEVQYKWDAATGRPLGQQDSRPTHGNRWIYSPDSKLMAWLERDWDATVHLKDVTTGKELRVIEADLKRLTGAFFSISPDNKILAGAGWERQRPCVCLWDVETGKELLSPGDPPGNGYTYSLFSPNGKYLALGCHDQTVRLWDIATGKEFRVLGQAPQRPEYGPIAIAFSRDGKALAVSVDRKVRIYEIATGQERRMLPVGASSLGFSPDGLRLVTGSGDTTALVWDITGALQAGTVKPDLDSWWADLASDDAARACRAIGLLSTTPQSVAFLKDRLRPATIDDRRTARCLANLESDQFTVREQATQELEELADLAEPAMRQVLAQKPSLEFRQRVERLLQKVGKQQPTGEALRAWRALEVLEALGTPEARQVLEKLSRGAAAAQLTREAKSSLARLTSHSDAKP